MRDADPVVIAGVRQLAQTIASKNSAVRKSPDVDAEDIAQMVAMDFSRQDPAPDNWKAWTRKVTERKLIDLARKRAAVLVPDDLFSAILRQQSLSSRVGIRELWADVLESLGERRAAVLTDRLLGYSNAEIAERRGYASAASVATVLSRTRKTLAEERPELEIDLNSVRSYDGWGARGPADR